MGNGEYDDIAIYKAKADRTGKPIMCKQYPIDQSELISKRLSNRYSMKPVRIREDTTRCGRLHETMSIVHVYEGLFLYITTTLEEVRSLEVCLLTIEGGLQLFQTINEEIQNQIAWNKRVLQCPKCKAKNVYSG